MNEVNIHNILLVESSTIDFVFPQINHSEPLPGISFPVCFQTCAVLLFEVRVVEGSGIWVGYIVPTRSQIPIP